MNASRLVSFIGAIIITATEWAGFSGLQPHTQSMEAFAAPVASDTSNAALPTVVVISDRYQSLPVARYLP
jgi:hypothetical protein